MLADIRRVAGRKDEGASAVEYGLLIAAIAALIVIVVCIWVSSVWPDKVGDPDRPAVHGPESCAMTVDGVDLPAPPPLGPSPSSLGRLDPGPPNG